MQHTWSKALSISCTHTHTHQRDLYHDKRDINYHKRDMQHTWSKALSISCTLCSRDRRSSCKYKRHWLLEKRHWLLEKRHWLLEKRHWLLEKRRVSSQKRTVWLSSLQKWHILHQRHILHLDRDRDSLTNVQRSHIAWCNICVPCIRCERQTFLLQMRERERERVCVWTLNPNL